jgi:hypothetical protein
MVTLSPSLSTSFLRIKEFTRESLAHIKLGKLDVEG